MNGRRFSYVFVLLASLVFSGAAADTHQGADGATSIIAEVFADHMVLQRDQPANIWGRAEAHQAVEVLFISKVYKSTADASGHWKISLPGTKVGGPYEMEIAAGEIAIKLVDIFIGDVWLASGQSNMAFRLKAADDPNKAGLFAEAGNRNIRMYNVARVVEGGKVLDQPDRPWAKASTENIGDWSAVAYYFARGLFDHLKVPVGIINCSQGASTVEAWMNATALEEAGVPVKKFAGIEHYYKDPSVLYDKMLAKLIPYTLKGVIWYQGESNTTEPEAYTKLFPAMINQWRSEWKQNDLPFVFAQLPNFRRKEDKTGVSWAVFRQAQHNVAHSVPKCAMVVLIDVGDDDDIHPRNKRVVGERMVLAARSVAYDEAIEFSGPVLDGISFKGKKAKVLFDHVGTGLVIKGGKLMGFEVCDERGAWTSAEASIKRKDVLVSHREGAKITGVRYAWANAPDVNLYNANGLPAVPFTTSME